MTVVKTSTTTTIDAAYIGEPQRILFIFYSIIPTAVAYIYIYVNLIQLWRLHSSRTTARASYRFSRRKCSVPFAMMQCYCLAEGSDILRKKKLGNGRKNGCRGKVFYFFYFCKYQLSREALIALQLHSNLGTWINNCLSCDSIQCELFVGRINYIENIKNKRIEKCF